jgi:hypothetical protein
MNLEERQEAIENGNFGPELRDQVMPKLQDAIKALEEAVADFEPYLKLEWSWVRSMQYPVEVALREARSAQEYMESSLEQGPAVPFSPAKARRYKQLIEKEEK